MCYMCDQQKQVEKATTAVEFWNPTTEIVEVATLADAVRAAAMREPEKVYDRPEGGGCKYTHKDPETGDFCPGCIVGQGVFDLTGKVVDNIALTGNVNNSRWAIALNAVVEEEDYWGDRKPKDALSKYLLAWLRNVQYRQDSGDKWGDAVAYADENTSFVDATRNI